LIAWLAMPVLTRLRITSRVWPNIEAGVFM